MPASVLQITQTVNLAAGASTSIPHGLVSDGNGLIPNVIYPDRDTEIRVTSADDTEVTYENTNTSDAVTAIFLVQFDHSIQQSTPDGQPLQFFYQGGVAGSGGGAAASDESNLWYPPATPNALDDEFTSGTLDPSWTTSGFVATPIDNYDLTFTSGLPRQDYNSSKPSWWLLQGNGGNGFTSVRKVTTIPTNILFWYRAKSAYNNVYTVADDGNGFIALTLTQDASNFVRIIYQFLFGGSLRVRFERRIGGAFTTIYDTFTAFQRQQPLEYFALHKIGNTYHGWAADASQSWIYLSSTVAAISPVQVEIGFGSNSVSSGFTPGPYVVGFDYLRALDTTNFLL